MINKKIDLVIIGGGPAGVMAAYWASKNGAKVIIIEKTKVIGNKLKLTGGGRCNLTTSIFDIQKLKEKYHNGNFLISGFTKFGPKEVVEFFEKNNVKTKKEITGKIFTESDSSQDVINLFYKLLKENNVEIIYDEVLDVVKNGNKIEKIILKNTDEIYGDNFLISTGGNFYSHTGSTGDGYKFAKKLGHTITDIYPSILPLIIDNNFIKDLQGYSVKDIKINLFKNNKKIKTYIGDIIFTHFGISGPIVFDISFDIADHIEKDDLKLFIDFKKEFKNEQEFENFILEDFEKNKNKNIKNYLEILLSEKLSNFIFKNFIKEDIKVNSLKKEQRKEIIKNLKSLELNISKKQNKEWGMVTRGGIDIKEIDPKTMKSKIIDNLFFAGEVIDVDASTGGFSLQLCWTTGYIVGDFFKK